MATQMQNVECELSPPGLFSALFPLSGRFLLQMSPLPENRLHTISVFSLHSALTQTNDVMFRQPENIFIIDNKEDFLTSAKNYSDLSSKAPFAHVDPSYGNCVGPLYFICSFPCSQSVSTSTCTS